MHNNRITMVAALAGILAMPILAAISHTNHVLAKCDSSLSLGAYPNKGTVGATTGKLPVSLSGKLTCGGSEVGGATITITGTGGGSRDVTTNEFGSYGLQHGFEPGTYTVEAHYNGDSDHTSASATRTITASASSGG
jgi:hypothetical protein